jgi:hypothetical protein
VRVPPVPAAEHRHQRRHEHDTHDRRIDEDRDREPTPFVLERGDQVRPAPPPALTSAAYAATLNEVQSLGSQTSTTRSAEQTEIGKFWNPPIQNSGIRSPRRSRQRTTAACRRRRGCSRR